jgi:hypothetical protein
MTTPPQRSWPSFELDLEAGDALAAVLERTASAVD